MVTVKAKEKVYYGGRDRLPGEQYEMDDREHSEINVLCLLEKIERVADVPREKPVQAATAQQPAPLYQTAAIQPEGDSGAKDEEEKAPPEEEGEEGQTRRRQYRRRDMRPER